MEQIALFIASQCIIAIATVVAVRVDVSWLKTRQEALAEEIKELRRVIMGIKS